MLATGGRAESFIALDVRLQNMKNTVTIAGAYALLTGMLASAIAQLHKPDVIDVTATAMGNLAPSPIEEPQHGPHGEHGPIFRTISPSSVATVSLTRAAPATVIRVIR